MGNTIAAFVEQLKKRLGDSQGKYNHHWSMLGDTQGGFYSADEFDFDALLKEIDTFSEEFKRNTEAHNAGVTGWPRKEDWHGKRRLFGWSG